MTDSRNDELPEVDATGPEFTDAGDLNYDEAHGAGEHLDVPAALKEEAEQRRTISPSS